MTDVHGVAGLESVLPTKELDINISTKPESALAEQEIETPIKLDSDTPNQLQADAPIVKEADTPEQLQADIPAELQADMPTQQPADRTTPNQQKAGTPTKLRSDASDDDFEMVEEQHCPGSPN